jgi:hypothetical protein
MNMQDPSSGDKVKKQKQIKEANALPCKKRFLWNPPCFYAGRPSLFAAFLYYCDGNMAAAVLLQYIVWRCKAGTAKFKRMGKEWIVMSAEEWGFAAGLTHSQLHRRAFPELRKHPQFIEIRQGKVSAQDKQKKMFIRLMDDNFPLTYGEDWCRYVSKHFYHEKWHGFPDE